MAIALRYLICGTISAWLFCAGLPSAVAQGQPAANGGGRQFTVLAGGESDWTGVAYQSTPTKAIALSFNYQRRSEVQKVAGETLVFTREIIDPATGRPTRMPVARVTWPAGVRTALLIFVPRTTPGVDGMEFDVHAVDDGLQAFPSDSMRVLNVTPVTLLGRIGDWPAEFKPGVSSTIPLADVVPEGKQAVALALGVQLKSEVKMLYLGPLVARPQTRVLVMVLPPRAVGSHKLRIFTIAQTMPTPVTR